MWNDFPDCLTCTFIFLPSSLPANSHILRSVRWPLTETTELYNNWRTCSYTSFSQRSVRKNMADFQAKWRHFHWLLVPKFMVIATEQGSNISPPQSPPPPVLKKIFQLIAVNPCCFDIFDIFFRLLTICSKMWKPYTLILVRGAWKTTNNY
jgi:hypothetical protein